MKVTAFIGSARKKSTYHATKQFMDNLQSLGNVEYEIVQLSDYRLEVCKGCQQCFNKGEEFCPLKDDRDKLIGKMTDSDGIVFASPNYSFQVSAFMKIFLDRLGFIFHRPRFFGKAFTNIIVQGIYGGNNIVEYLDFVGNRLGFNVVNGYCLTALEPMTEKDQKLINKIIDKHSRKFYSMLVKKEYPTPTFFKLMIFRISRTKIKVMLNDSYRDYAYYKKNGWFESDYYYQIKLDPIKKIAGKFFDLMARLTI
jgi:multimeric flavodoxin WrbA